MTALKKNPILTGALAVCVLAFLGLGYMAFAAKGELTKSQKRLKSVRNSYKNAANAEIAPTEANLLASQDNLAELQRQFSLISGELRRGTRLTSTDDGIAVTTGIRDYIRNFQRLAEAQVNEDTGEANPIELPENFAFGFEDYYNNPTIPDDPEEVIYLDKQRQVLSYMMTKLTASKPKSIDKVERQKYGVTYKPEGGNTGFVVHPTVSAAVPGAINTMAFEIQFTGGTDSLRDFFNNLNTFDLPIVVRSVGVERSSDGGITEQTDTTENLEDIFGGFGGESVAAPVTPQASREPVIIGDHSQFTLIVEYFEVVQPTSTPTPAVDEEEQS